MAIDGSPFTFHQLANKVLPADMARMREAIGEVLSMSTFARTGIGPKTILRELGLDGDFAGCYVLIDEGQPVYVGISRTVIQRLLQHVKGRTHYDASLAYQIARKKCPHDLSRNEAVKNPDFAMAFKEAKEYLESLSVAFISVEDDVELYLFEVYCAMELNTCEWNAFRTH